MKRTLLALVFLSLSSIGFSQLYNIRLGGNASVGATLTKTYVNGTKTDEDTSGVVATIVPFSFDFMPWKFVSFSASLRAGSWLNEDPNDNSYVIKEKKTSSFLLGVKLYPVAKDNFQLYFGLDIGSANFQTELESTGFFLINSKQRWSGTNTAMNIGMNWYYGGKFGSYFQLGYTGYNFNVKSYTINNEDQLSKYNLSANMLVKGVQAELGLCYKFGQL